MYGVSKITVCEEVALVTFHQVSSSPLLLADILSSFAQAQINIDMISQTAPQGNHINLSFTVPSAQLVEVLALVNRFRETHTKIRPMVSSGNCKIQLYGEEMRGLYGVAASALAAVAKTDAELMLITTSEVDISLLVSQTHSNEVIHALEAAFQVSVS